MKIASRATAMLALGAWTPAQAIDCGKAMSAIERRLCADRTLADLDGTVNVLYGKARASAVGPARAALLQQQRAWLAERDQTCASTDRACLVRIYAKRRDELTAFAASAGPTGAQSRQSRPVVLRRRWRAAAPSAPGGNLPAAGADLVRQLDFAGLPRIGETVSAAAGKLCVADQPCDAFTWSVTTVGELEGGARIASDLGLAPDSVAYTGTNGSPRSALVLIAEKGGGLSAVFGVCGPAATHCRSAVQPWRPLASGAGFAVGNR